MAIEAKKVRLLKKIYDLNDEKVSRHLGIAIQSYRNKEKGLTEFKLSEAKKLADLYSMSIEDLFFNEDIKIKSLNF